MNTGRVTALVMTALSPNADGTTSATTQVTGSLRRSDAATGTLLVCSSTGELEEFLRAAIARRLALAP